MILVFFLVSYIKKAPNKRCWYIRVNKLASSRRCQFGTKIPSESYKIALLSFSNLHFCPFQLLHVSNVVLLAPDFVAKIFNLFMGHSATRYAGSTGLPWWLVTPWRFSLNYKQHVLPLLLLLAYLAIIVLMILVGWFKQSCQIDLRYIIKYIITPNTMPLEIHYACSIPANSIPFLSPPCQFDISF